MKKNTILAAICNRIDLSTGIKCRCKTRFLPNFKMEYSTKCVHMEYTYTQQAVMHADFAALPAVRLPQRFIPQKFIDCQWD